MQSRRKLKLQLHRWAWVIRHRFGRPFSGPSMADAHLPWSWPTAPSWPSSGAQTAARPRAAVTTYPSDHHSSPLEISCPLSCHHLPVLADHPPLSSSFHLDPSDRPYSFPIAAARAETGILWIYLRIFHHQWLATFLCHLVCHKCSHFHP